MKPQKPTGFGSKNVFFRNPAARSFINGCEIVTAGRVPSRLKVKRLKGV